MVSKQFLVSDNVTLQMHADDCSDRSNFRYNLIRRFWYLVLYTICILRMILPEDSADAAWCHFSRMLASDAVS